MAAARLERIVGVVEVRLLNSDIGSTILAGQPWGAMRETTQRLAAERYRRGSDDDPPALAEALQALPALLERAERLMKERNLIVHGHWFTDEEPLGDQVTVMTMLQQRWDKVTKPGSTAQA